MEIELKFTTDESGQIKIERELTDDEKSRLISTNFGDSTVIYIFTE